MVVTHNDASQAACSRSRSIVSASTPEPAGSELSNWYEGLKRIGHHWFGHEELRPGERTLPEIDNPIELLQLLAQLPKNPLGALQQMAKTHGPDSEVVAPSGRRFLFLSDPVALKDVFQETDSRSDTFRKGSSMVRGAAPIFGKNNIIIGDDEAWQSRRKAISSLFGRTRFEQPAEIEKMQSLVENWVQELREKIDSSPGGALVTDLDQEFTALTMRVFLSTFMGIDDLPEEKIRAIMRPMRETLDAFPMKALNFTPFPLEDIGRIFPFIRTWL